jgi:hypothetical protein
MKTIFLLLFLFVCINLKAQEKELIIKDFIEDVLDLSAREHEEKDMNDRPCAMLKIRTGLTGISFTKTVEKQKATEGELQVWISEGTKTLEITKAGYPLLQYIFPVEIKASTVYTCRLFAKGDKIEASLDANLLSLTFHFNQEAVFVAKESGAPVRSAGKVSGFSLAEGKYSFEISKEGFEMVKQEVSLRKDTTIAVNLKAGLSKGKMKLPGIISVFSVPEGAKVYLNDQEVGVTPYTDQVISGAYTIRIYKELYQAFHSTIAIKEGETKELPNITLPSNFGILSVSTDPQDAKIYLDGKLVKEKLSEQKIEAGKHTIKVSADSYYDSLQTFNIINGQKHKIMLRLKPAFGTIKIFSMPEAAMISIDGENIGKAPVENVKLSKGEHIISASLGDLFSEAEEKITISEGMTYQKTLILSQNFGTLMLTSDGAKLYVNDKYVGINQYEAKLKHRTYKVNAVKVNHKDANQTVFITKSETKRIKLEPSPIMGSVSVFTKPETETKGAEIFMNETKINKTSPAVFPYIIGTYSLTIKKNGFDETTQQIKVSEGQNTKIEVKMTNQKFMVQQKISRSRIFEVSWLVYLS